jgi:hypothetical protein
MQNFHSSRLGIMAFILEASVGVCMWHPWQGWEIEGKIETRDDLICISLDNWDFFSDDP